MPEEHGLKGKVAKGLFWGGLNNGTQQILNLVIGIFLARILTPSDYGMVGVLTVFSAVAGALQEGGFISALTNRRNATKKDFTSVFWFTTSCGVCFYIILYFLAPLIARFYEIPSLIPLARFIFLGFLLSSMNIAARAMLFRDLRVKDTAIITVVSLACSGFIGILLAVNGYAYWGLAWQTVSYTFFMTVLSFLFTRWYPSMHFSMKPIVEMLGFSSKVVVTNVFVILNNNIFAVLLGKFYTPADVGDFNQANKWNTMGYSFITGMMTGVSQPALSRVADDKVRLLNVFRKLLRFVAFISFPLMLGLSLVAKDFIVIAIGEKWYYSAIILQMLCVWGAFFPVANLFSNFLLSVGKSGLYMWITILLACVQMVSVYFSYPYGLERMITVFIAINILWLGIWYMCARRYISLRFFDFIADTAPFMLLAVVSVLISYLLSKGITDIYVSLIVKVSITAIVYLGLLWLSGAKILKESFAFLIRRKAPDSL